MRRLFRKMSALLLCLGLAIEPGLAALPGHIGMQSYAAQKSTDSNLHRSKVEDADENENTTKFSFGAAAFLGKASGSNISLDNSLFSLASGNDDNTNENTDSSTEVPKGGRALLIAQTGDESLKIVPSQDMAALKATLLRTEQFAADDITILEVPQDAPDDSYRRQIWKWIDQAAADKSQLTFIAYSGHGDYHLGGNSELSLGDNNNISAQQLKEHVSKLSGKVILAIDCCYSGGMIMPTSLEDDVDVDEDAMGMTDVSSEDLQELADDEMRAFVQEFKSAKASKKTTSSEDVSIATVEDTDESSNSSELQYYIYAAASAYETSKQSEYGGQLVVALGHALGYDRNDGDYAVFAADTSWDNKITATELADYVNNSCTVATPTVYPNKRDDVLFSYSGDAENCPGLYVRSVNKKNLKISDVGSLTVEVEVANLDKDNDIEVSAVAASIECMELDAPGYEDDIIAERVGEDEVTKADTTKTIEAGRTGLVEFTFTNNLDKAGIKKGGRFLIRIVNTERPNDYGIADFYVVGSDGDAAAPDKTALALRKPAVVYNASEATEVSAMVPIDVQFDVEPTEKTGYAGCILTARYYDLGESSGVNTEEDLKGYQIDADGQILNNGETGIDEDTNRWKSIYTTIPTYTRTNIYGDTANGSTYNKVWDVSGLENGHYYALQVICKYGDGSEERKLATFIKKVDKTTADQAKNVIGEVNIAFKDFSRLNFGIRLGDNWSNNTVAAVSENLEEYLNSQSFTVRTEGEGDKKQDITYIHASIEGTDGGSGWYELDSKDEFDENSELESDAVFETGKSYVSRIHLTIDRESNAKFGDKVLFTAAGHKLYDDGTTKSVVLDTEDVKEAIVYIRHDNIGIDESKLSVYPAGTKTNKLADGASLKMGDEIDVYCADGYTYRMDDSFAEVKGEFDGFKRYKVLGSNSDPSILLYHKFSGKVENIDSCGARYIMFTVKDAPTIYKQGDDLTISGDFTANGKTLTADEKKNVVLVLESKFEDKAAGEVVVTVTHSLRLQQDGKTVAEYPVVTPQKGAKLSYLISYPSETKNYSYYGYQLAGNSGEIEVTVKAQKDGLRITAEKNGSFTLNGYSGGNGGGDEKETQKETEKETQKETEKQNEINKRQSSSESSSSGSHSDRSSNEPTSKAVFGSWQKSSQSLASGNVDGYRFKLANGSYATGWQLINWNKGEHWFYFGQDGYMRTGWLKDANKWYYLEKDGTMALGWHLENGSWYYLEGSGSMVTGWYRVGLNWYYFAADGKMQLGRQLINGTEYNFRTDGSWISTEA